MNEKFLNMAEFITKSQRNKDKIVYDGYEYNYKERREERIIWRCNKKGCLALLYTTFDLIFEKKEIFHNNHARNISKLRQKRIISEIKKRSLLTSESSRNVLLQIIDNNKDYINENISVKYFNDEITRNRRKKMFTFEEENDIPREIKYTRSGANFVLYNGLKNENENEKIVIFGTETNMIHLNNNKIWLFDGTFSVVPSIFSQLVTIQCEIRGEYIPLIYCLMPSKSFNAYLSFLKILSEKYDLKAPDYLILDFEAASFNSFKTIFPRTKIYTCLFHFSQIIWRKIQSLGYTSIYNSNSCFNFQVRLIMALAFVPSNDIQAMGDKLLNYFERENSCENTYVLFQWFKKKFINAETCSINHRPEVWSVYMRVKKNLPRTTNSMEGFHRHLNNVCETNHPSILTLGKELVNEQFFSEKKINESLKNIRKNLAKHSKKDEDLVEVIDYYKELYDIEYLKAIVFKFHFPLNH